MYVYLQCVSLSNTILISRIQLFCIIGDNASWEAETTGSTDFYIESS